MQSSIQNLSSAQLYGASRRSVTVLLGTATGLYVLIEVVSGLAAATAAHFLGLAAAGIGPALVFGLAGFVAVPAGKYSDNVGRRPVLVLGSLFGACGAGLAGLSVAIQSSALFILALVAIGFSVGVLRLVKAASADVYPHHSRTKGIGLVQMGGLAGAWLGLGISGISHANVQLATFPWFATSVLLMFTAIVVFILLRPDPLHISNAIEPEEHLTTLTTQTSSRTLHEILKMAPKLGAVLISICLVYGVMVMDMSLAGTLLSRIGISTKVIMLVMAFHFTGMFGPMRVVGRWASRYNRKPLGLAGIILVGIATAIIGWIPLGAVGVTIALFVVGVGWCLGWVAGLGELAEFARSNERGALMALADLGSDFLAAFLTLAGGAALSLLDADGLALIGATAMLGALVISAQWWPTPSQKPAADVERKTPDAFTSEPSDDI